MTPDDDRDVPANWAALINMVESDWTALDERLEEARAALASGESRQAAEVAVWVLERDQENIDALLVVIFAALDLGDRVRARAVANRMLSLDGTDWRVHIANAWVLLGEKQRKEAASEANFALHIEPYEALAFGSAAEILSRIGGKATIAEDAANRALELDPTAAGPHLVLARLRGYRGDWQSSEALCRQVLHRSPTNEVALASLAFYQQKQGKFKEANQTFDALADHWPESRYLIPDEASSEAAEFLGCIHTFLIWAGLSTFVLLAVLAAKPTALLVVLTVVAGAVTMITPLRTAIATRLRPRAMARAKTRKSWSDRHPDVVAGVLATTTMLILAVLTLL